LQEYIKIFAKSRAKAPHVQATTVIDAAIDGLKVGSRGEYLDRRRPKIEKHLFDIMQEYCKSERGRQLRIDKYNKKTNRSPRQNGKLGLRTIKDLRRDQTSTTETM
jgi:hypothetical protein